MVDVSNQWLPEMAISIHLSPSLRVQVAKNLRQNCFQHLAMRHEEHRRQLLTGGAEDLLGQGFDAGAGLRRAFQTWAKANKA